ncbi:MAG: phosphoribosyl-ATP diphosphatase [Butyricicoccaceae bacterium]
MSSFEQMGLSSHSAAQNRKEGSYTCYLFEKGIDKILKKVGEECAETIIAAKNGDKTELVGEINDVFYHMSGHE